MDRLIFECVAFAEMVGGLSNGDLADVGCIEES
jgi:hypothetical protein